MDKQKYVPSTVTQLTSENWLLILQDPRTTMPKDIEVLRTIYEFPEHEAGAMQIGKAMGIEGSSPHSPVNSYVVSHAKRIAKFFKIDFSKRAKGNDCFYDLFFRGYSAPSGFIWVMRPELAEAFREFEKMNYEQQKQPEIGRAEDIKRQLTGADMHDLVLLAFEDYRKEYPDFVYYTRQKNENRLNNGYWFQGKWDYASVGLYQMSAGDKSTRSIALEFSVEDNRIIWDFRVTFKNETDEARLELYKKIVDKFEMEAVGDKEDQFVTTYEDYELNGLSYFLDEEKPLLDEMVEAAGIKNAFLQKSKFDKMINRIYEYRNKSKKLNTKKEVESVFVHENNTLLNQILYGPPGTGKTYHTINRAIEIANPSFDLTQDRLVIKEEFDRLRVAGQIIFTTFHQSMSYEDFVEGIKPVSPDANDESGQVTYEIEGGLFKRTAIKAAFAVLDANQEEKTEKILTFSQAYDKLVEIISEKLETEGKYMLETKSGGQVQVDAISDKGNFKITHIGKDTIYTVSKNRLSRLAAFTPDQHAVNNIHEHTKSAIGGSNSSAYWAVLNAVRKQKPTTLNIVRPKVDYDAMVQAVQEAETKSFERFHSAPNYVIIIDEINRGNVSEIFGELITLTEQDKRLGKAESIKLTLPYSKTEFGVPPNLYLIGTMNTADRSVEALDTALRRRFHFTEMPPQPELLSTDTDGYDLRKILQTINERIEILLDRDHLIGHSYFFKVKDEADLLAVFQDRIVPLLQEYFYSDHAKIELVLGKGFCTGEKIKTKEKKNVFAKTGQNNSSDEYDLSERVIYRFPVYGEDFDLREAVNDLLNEKATTDVE